MARLQLVQRGKRLGFGLRDIAEFLDLYDLDPRHAAQTGRLLDLTRARLARLREQRAALDQTIAELDAIEGQALGYLAEIGGEAPDP